MKNEHRISTRLVLRLPAACANPSVAIERWLLALWQITPHSHFHLWWKTAPITLELLSTKRSVRYQVVLESRTATDLTRSLLPSYFPGIEVERVGDWSLELGPCTLQTRLELASAGWMDLAPEPTLDLAAGLVEAMTGPDGSESVLQWTLRPTRVKWEKQSLPGFWLAGRLVVTGESRGACIVHGRRIVGALGQHAGANRLRASSFSDLKRSSVVTDPCWPFAIRPAGKPCSPSQVAQLFHPPSRPALVGALNASVASRLAVEPRRTGLLLGEGRTTAGAVTDVRLPVLDLMRHMLVVGPSGSGKTTFLAHLARELMRSEVGVTVLDPHGSLTSEIGRTLPTAAEQTTAVIRLADVNNPIGINPFRTRDPFLAADDFVEILRRTTGRSHWGPVLDITLRHVALAISETGGSLIEALRLLEDALFRDQVVRGLTNQATVRFLEEGERSEVRLRPALTRLQRLAASGWLRNILGQPETTLDMRALMDGQRSLLADLSGLGLGASQLVGSLLLLLIRQAALSRRLDSSPHVVILDEAALFLSPTVSELLDQGRKFNFGLVVAVQRLGQLEPESVRNALLANVGSTIAFTMHDRDEASQLARRAALHGFSAEALMRLPRFEAYAQLVIDSEHRQPAWLRVPPPPKARSDAPSVMRLLVANGRHHTRPKREVEAEIERRERTYDRGEPEVIEIDVNQDPFRTDAA